MTALFESIKRVLPTGIKLHGREAMEMLDRARLRSASMSREEFLSQIKSAVETGRGYAAAKIGASQQAWMYYEIFLSKHRPPQEVAEYEASLRFHSLKQEGVFPDSLEFYLEYNRFYVEQLRNLDCLGIVFRPAWREAQLIKHYGLTNRLIYYPLQEADRSTPSNEANCYLPYFKDKKVLLICPFAEFLRDRTTQKTFEQVWSKIGKRWFHPASVEALEFPYGFARETHQRYATVLDLLAEIQTEISKRDFDVALVGAGGLSIPIVSYVKNLGKVGIDLGGALQFTFGVSGKRWKDRESYQTDFFNEHWAYLPEKYKPRETGVCDDGAYW